MILCSRIKGGMMRRRTNGGIDFYIKFLGFTQELEKSEDGRSRTLNQRKISQMILLSDF